MQRSQKTVFDNVQTLRHESSKKLSFIHELEFVDGSMLRGLMDVSGTRGQNILRCLFKVVISAALPLRLRRDYP